MAKVLIIDDSPTQLSSLKIFFMRKGFEVETAKDGIEGFVKVYKCAPDVILSDVLMPHLGGFQLCRLLKSNKETKIIPFVMLTVLDKSIDKFWANQSGADLFLRKDYDMAKIVDATLEIVNKNPVKDEDKIRLTSYEIEQNSVITQINKILDDELMKTTIANKFRELTSYLSDEKELARDIFEILSSIVDYDIACIYFRSPDITNKKRIIFNEQNLSVDENTMITFWQQLLPENIRDFKAEKITSKENLPRLNSMSELISRKEMDFYHETTLIGKLCFYSKENINWDTIRFTEIIRSELDLFMRLKYLYTKTSYLSITDELTKLYTRRHLKTSLSQEFERARRYGTISTIAMLDIDNFKKINDTFGHLAGDFVLKEIALILINTLRKSDFIYRYGGEEICMVMPETVLYKAFVPLERIRKTIEDKDFIFEGKLIKLTVSIGAATYSGSMKEAEDLIEAADHALYRAKKCGKNQVVVNTNE